MSRGGGRGRGGDRGGRGNAFDFRQIKSKPFELFPENNNLPSPVYPLPKEEKDLTEFKFKFEGFWMDSCYYFEDVPKSKKEDKEIEQYSDRSKPKTQTKRESLASYLKLTPSNYPPELIQGSKRVQPDNKKAKWCRGSDAQLLNMFDKIENTKEDEKDDTDKKDESEDAEELEEEEVESSDDGDYNQNIDFDDDDDDDFNQGDEPDEDYYE